MGNPATYICACCTHAHYTFSTSIYVFFFRFTRDTLFSSLQPFFVRRPFPISFNFNRFGPFRFTYFSNYSKHIVQRITYSAFVKRDGFFSHDIQYNTEISFILFHLVNLMQRHKCAKHVYTMTHVSICIRTATYTTNVHTHIRAIQALILFTRIYKFTNIRTRAK